MTGHRVKWDGMMETPPDGKHRLRCEGCGRVFGVTMEPPGWWGVTVMDEGWAGKCPGRPLTLGVHVSDAVVTRDKVGG